MKNKLCTHPHERKVKALWIMVYAGFALLLLSSCAYQKSESAGRINGVYIKNQDFMNSLRGHYTGFMLEKDRTPDQAEIRELYNQTWRNITIHVILKDYFDKYNIAVTEREVLDSLLNNIPLTMKTAPVFQTKGRFDKEKYVDMLLNDRTGRLGWLKRHYYNYYVPLEKLKLELIEKEIISKKELTNLNKVMNNTADIDWIVFDPVATDVSVSRAEIEAYYNSRLNDYQITPNADLGWVSVPVRLNQEDIDATGSKIDSIYFELTNRKPFSAMVERFSETSTARSGGSLGFIKLEELSGTVRSALERIEKNGFTRPLKLDNYWVIYQLAERTPNLVKLNELVLEIKPGEANISQVKDDAIHLRDLALQLDLDTAAHEMNYTYRRSGTVSRDSLWLPDSEVSAYLMDRAFTQRAGAVLEPVYSTSMQAWIVTEVIEVQPFRYKPLLTVNDEVYNLLLRQKQQKKTLDNAVAWAQNNRNRQLEAARNSALQVISTPGLLITDSVISQPISSMFVGVVESHLQKKPQKPYPIGDKVLLPVVLKVSALSPTQFTFSDTRKYYFDHINPDWFDKWLNQQIRKADVNIWFTYP